MRTIADKSTPLASTKPTKPTTKRVTRTVQMSSFWPGTPFTKVLGRLLADKGFKITIQSKMLSSPALRSSRAWGCINLGRVWVHTDKRTATLYLTSAMFDGTEYQLKNMRTTLPVNCTEAEGHERLATKLLTWIERTALTASTPTTRPRA